MPSVNAAFDTETPRSVTASVGAVDDLEIGEMRLARVGDHRLVVARTADGTHALDNACPHQGYGLATGSFDGERITCQWHNWKFCVADGTCKVGEENVASHAVEIRDGEVWDTVREPTPAEQRERLWPSLQRAIAADYRGQIARDTARLLAAGADPVDVIWEGVRFGAPRAEDGVGHEMASALDCLTAVELYDDLDRTLPITQALAGIAETTRGREPQSEPALGAPLEPSLDTTGRGASVPVDAGEFTSAVEAEDGIGAVAVLSVALRAGADLATVRSWFIEAVAAHHFSYGHGAIYTQKAFELLERAGWHRAADLLPHLVTSLVLATRADSLPYMRAAQAQIETVDLAALAAAERAGNWSGLDDLAHRLLDADDAVEAVSAAVQAAHDGAGLTGVLDAVSVAVSMRMLRYDVAVELRPESDFGWLDISHGLTYARAARWALGHHRGEATARLVLYTVFQCFDTGRHERRTFVAAESAGAVRGTLTEAILEGRHADAVALAEHGEITAVGDELRRAAQLDGAGSFIVVAHLVKTAQAALEESLVIDSSLPLMAVARVAAAPRRERFVARAAASAIELVRTGSPPVR